MRGFTKFDPRAFLGSEEPRPIPAKSAKLAKACNQPDRTLATLAAYRAGSQSPAALTGDDAPAELLAPLFKPISPANGQRARIGRVEDRRDDSFLHYCGKCEAWGAYGYGVNLRAGRPGRWYCAAHRPRRNKP